MTEHSAIVRMRLDRDGIASVRLANVGGGMMLSADGAAIADGPGTLTIEVEGVSRSWQVMVADGRYTIVGD